METMLKILPHIWSCVSQASALKLLRHNFWFTFYNGSELPKKMYIYRKSGCSAHFCALIILLYNGGMCTCWVGCPLWHGGSRGDILNFHMHTFLLFFFCDSFWQTKIEKLSLCARHSLAFLLESQNSLFITRNTYQILHVIDSQSRIRIVKNWKKKITVNEKWWRKNWNLQIGSFENYNA